MKVALAQINIVWENKSENMKKCENFIKEARKRNVDLIIFPEMTLTGFSMNVEKICDKNHETLSFFRTLAKKYNLFIGAGYVEMYEDRGQNKFSIISPKGEVICSYIKMHPFSYGEEDKFYIPGNKIYTADVLGMEVVPFICYDLRFPEIFQIASKTAQLITVSANWPGKRQEHWKCLLRSRAIENQCYIAGVNTVGKVCDIYYSGDSSIIDPYGNVLCMKSNSEELIVADIKKQKVFDIQESFKFKNDRREDLYKNLHVY